MYSIYFYKNASGEEPVADYMLELKKKNDKDSRIKLRKLQEYLQVLATYGYSVGEPYVKKIRDEIYELRPSGNRVFFVAWNGSCYVLLHVFQKKTQKTPKREIEQAERELEAVKKRDVWHE